MSDPTGIGAPTGGRCTRELGDGSPCGGLFDRVVLAPDRHGRRRVLETCLSCLQDGRPRSSRLLSQCQMSGGGCFGFLARPGICSACWGRSSSVPLLRTVDATAWPFLLAGLEQEASSAVLELLGERGAKVYAALPKRWDVAVGK